MDYKKELKNLITSVKTYRKNHNLPYRNEDIAKVLGYTRTYFSALTGKDGKVTDEHIKQMKLNFPELYENHTSANGVTYADIFKKDIDPGKAIGLLFEKQISFQASLSVLQQMIDKSVSDQIGKSIAIVSGERKQAEQMEIDRLFSELKRKL